MSALARLRSFVTALLRRRRLEREMDDEWQFHLDARVETLVAEGLPRGEAEHRARREFGDPARWKEEAHEARGLGPLQDAAADVRYAARSLRHAPAFTATALITLTLGVGLNTGVFSIANGLLFRGWPLPDPHEVVTVFHRDGSGPGPWWSGVSPAEYRFLRDAVTEIDLVAFAQAVQSLRFEHGDLDASVPARLVSGNYFDTLRVPVELGRGLRPDDDDVAAPMEVAVIGHGIWRDLFGESADVIGRTLRLNGVPFEIVGVAAPGATDSPIARAPAVWVPLAAYPRLTSDTEFNRGFLTNPGYCCVDLVGRFQGQASRAAAAAALEVAAARFSTRDEGGRRVRVTGTAAFDQPWRPEAAAALSIPVVGVLVVLLVACANLGNLHLARAMSRRRELAVRAALGAGRARIVRQLLAEGILVAAVASVTALGAAHVLVRSLARIVPQGPVDDLASLISPDLRVFGFSWLLATAAMLLAGIGPALAGTRRLVVTGPVSNERRVRLRVAFLAVQVALSMVLLVGAALFARSVVRAGTLIPDAVHDVVRVQVATRAPATDTGPGPLERGSGIAGDSASGIRSTFGSGSDATGWQRLYDLLQERSTPELRSRIAMAGGTSWMTVHADSGRAIGLHGIGLASVRHVTPEFFPLLGVRLLAGDLFRDTSDPADVVVNEALARTLWPGEQALGRTLTTPTPTSEPRRVIGVVSDAHWFDTAEPGPAVFMRGFGGLLVRDEPAVLEAVRAAVDEISPGAQVHFVPARPGSVDGYLVASSLAAALGLIALGMAAAGTFGVLMYLFTQRTRELAVRVALGARAAHVARLVAGEALGALAAGAAAGLVLSVLAAPVLRAYLLGLGPYDPLAYLAAVLVLAVAIAFASIAPIRRAVTIDPAMSLRDE